MDREIKLAYKSKSQVQLYMILPLSQSSHGLTHRFMLVPSLGINLDTPNHLPGTRNAAGVQLVLSTGRAHKGRSQPSACSSFSFIHNFRCLPGQELSTNLGSQNFLSIFSEEV